jgi:hypothetical protein
VPVRPEGDAPDTNAHTVPALKWAATLAREALLVDLVQIDAPTRDEQIAGPALPGGGTGKQFA